MRRHTLPEVATQRQKRREHGDEPPLQPARRADADQLTQEEPEIEAARVDQQPLADVRVAAQVHTAHPAGLVEMREGSFQALTAKRQRTRPRALRMRRRLRYTAARASGWFFQFRRPRSGSEM